MDTAMQGRKWRASAFVVVLSTLGGPVAAQPPDDDFWLTRTLLRLEIEADLHGLRVDDRQPDAGERPGLLRILGDSVTEVPILLETRGRFRLDSENCRYPPLRITVLADSATGLPSELRGFGRRARLVSSCRAGQDDRVRLEYVAYELRRMLDEWTYLVRPASARFIDSTGRDEPRDTWIFFREGNAHLRPRLGVQEVDLPDSIAVDPAVVSQVPAAMNEVFQYMIGNTDWSVSARHNQRLVVTPLGEYRSIPYDFDFSGLVDAPYATPDAYLPIKEVTERIFRGLCRPEAVYLGAIERIASSEDALIGVIEGVPGMSGGRAREARTYLSEFFREARRPEQLARYFKSACQERN